MSVLPVGALDAPIESSRDVALLLCRLGRVPGVELSHLGVRLLLFLLGQRPGYAAHYATIARAVESNECSVLREAHRLRHAGLVVWDRIAPHQRLPWGKYTRTNVNAFSVDVARLAALLGPRATLSKSMPSTPSKSMPSTRTISRSEQRPPPTPTKTLESPPVQREAISKSHSSEIETVAAEWDAAGIGQPVGPRERQALANRIGEGACALELRDAVRGAGAHPWLRTGARSAFAVVFASVASVARFAHEGRKVSDGAPASESDGSPASPRATPAYPPVSQPTLPARQPANRPIHPARQPARPSVHPARQQVETACQPASPPSSYLTQAEFERHRADALGRLACLQAEWARADQP